MIKISQKCKNVGSAIQVSTIYNTQEFKKANDIEIGDEVMTDIGVPMMVLGLTDNHLFGIIKEQEFFTSKISGCVKTGRHFNTIEQFLERIV